MSENEIFVLWVIYIFNSCAIMPFKIRRGVREYA